MNIKEDLVDYDFQGWPVFKMNLKEVLLGLGGIVVDNKIVFDLNDPFMKVYPRIFVDDGMAYGIDENCIIATDRVNDESEDNNEDKIYINIFREPIPSEERKKELIERWEEEERAVLKFAEKYKEEH